MIVVLTIAFVVSAVTAIALMYCVVQLQRTVDAQESTIQAQSKAYDFTIKARDYWLEQWVQESKTRREKVREVGQLRATLDEVCRIVSP